MNAIAKPPKPMRLNQKAVLIPAAQFAQWHEIASATPGLSGLELAVLSAVAAYYRLLHERGYASFPSIEKMAEISHKRSIDVTTAIKRLVSLGLIAVRPGSGRYCNEYLLALPKRVAASMFTAAVERAYPVPPF